MSDNKIKCTYRSKNGREITMEGNSDDRDFIERCKKLTGREGMNWHGEWYYPYYTYYSNPYYWGGSPYYYYYYPYFSYYPRGFYGGWRNRPYYGSY